MEEARRLRGKMGVWKKTDEMKVGRKQVRESAR